MQRAHLQSWWVITRLTQQAPINWQILTTYLFSLDSQTWKLFHILSTRLGIIIGNKKYLLALSKRQFTNNLDNTNAYLTQMEIVCDRQYKTMWSVEDMWFKSYKSFNWTIGKPGYVVITANLWIIPQLLN
jgi:hypothetical protein